MVALIEGKNSFFLADRAALIESDRELAWAEKHVVSNPAHRWVLGKFVEADRANTNRQFWSLGDLQMAKPTIAHAPMNMLHTPNHIVGAFVATDFIYPTEDNAAMENPYIEALGVIWKYYFPEEMRVVEAAHSTGQLFYSMECIARSITCAGADGCGQEFPYAGPRSESYCQHINEGPGLKQLNDPHFLGGALIIPPARPGWQNARISDLSELTKKYADQCEAAYEGIKQSAADLTPDMWEQLMLLIMACAHDEARDFNTEQRKKAASDGSAMADGSFPIKNSGDLKNAIKLAGNAKNPGAARAHIKKRAKALNLESMIPDTW